MYIKRKFRSSSLAFKNYYLFLIISRILLRGMYKSSDNCFVVDERIDNDVNDLEMELRQLGNIVYIPLQFHTFFKSVQPRDEVTRQGVIQAQQHTRVKVSENERTFNHIDN